MIASPMAKKNFHPKIQDKPYLCNCPTINLIHQPLSFQIFQFFQYLNVLVSAKPFSLFKKIKGRFPCLDSDLFSLFCSRQRII